MNGTECETNVSKQPEPSSSQRQQARVRRTVQRVAFSTLYRAGERIYEPLTKLLFGEAWARWRRSIIPLLNDGPVLDLGCGTGALVHEMARAGFQAFGIDREPSMLRAAHSKPWARRRLIRAESARLPFASAALAAVTVTFPAPFILERETLDEVARVLRQDGAFIVVLTGRTDELDPWRWPLRLMLRLFYGAGEEPTMPVTDVLAHPNLVGKWHLNVEGPDRVRVWIATRVANADAETEPTP